MIHADSTPARFSIARQVSSHLRTQKTSELLAAANSTVGVYSSPLTPITGKKGLAATLPFLQIFGPCN